MRMENGNESQVEKKVRKMEKRCETLDAEEKRKYVIIRGLRKHRRRLEKGIKEFFKTNLETEVEVQVPQASNLGQERKAIRVTFGSLEEKEEIMKQKKKLG